MVRSVSVTAALLLCLVGCGDGQADAIQGTWTAPIGVKDCLVAFTFSDGKAEQDRLCTLDSGSIGFEPTAGTYTVSGSNVTVSQVTSSCPSDVRRSQTFAFLQMGSSLRLATTEFALVLQKVAKSPSASGGILVFGCFDDKYGFTASPIHTLP